MAELQQTYEETQIVDDSIPSFEELVSEFVEGSRYEIAGQLRQARAAASVVSHYGRQSMKAFASEVGKSPSWVYQLAKVWMVYGHIFSGTDELSAEYSNQLETLGITHFIRSLRAPDPVQHAIRAHDEGWTTAQTDAKAREDEVPRNVETVEMGRCPHCGDPFRLSQINTWTEAV